jgi:hypothetical protein
MYKKILLLLFIFLPLLFFTLKSEKSSKGFIRNESSANTDIYSALEISSKGLDRETFNLGLQGYEKLKSEGKLRNPDLLTIIDYSQPSSYKRFYVVDLKNKKLLYNSLVAHGRNSGEVIATSFSNQEGSLKSSLGFFITGQSVSNAHTGYSLILNGMEEGINDQAFKRAIIMHGADYATEEFIQRNGRLGRSFGCPALPPEISTSVIDLIKDGSCLFIFYPNQKYLQESKILNKNSSLKD